MGVPAAPKYGSIIGNQKHEQGKAIGRSDEQYDRAKMLSDKQMERLDSLYGEQIGMGREQWENAKADRQRWVDKYQPIEDAQRENALNFDTDARRQQASGEAMASVQHTVDGQREQAQQRLESYGIDPSQTRAGAMDTSARLEVAGMMAQQGNAAVRDVRDTARQMQAEAINTGRTLPGQAQQGAQQALASGNAAMGNANNTIAGTFANTGTGASWSALGSQHGNSAGQNMNTQFQNQMDRYKAKQAAKSGGWKAAAGQLAGMAAGAYGGGYFSQAGANKAGAGEEGGPVTEGGVGMESIPGPTDTVPTMLAPGEYVIPANVVRAKGVEFFDKLKEKYAETPEDVAPPKAPIEEPIPEPAQPEGVRGYADGGFVRPEHEEAALRQKELQQQVANYQAQSAQPKALDTQPQQQQQGGGPSPQQINQLMNQQSSSTAAAPTAAPTTAAAAAPATAAPAAAAPAAAITPTTTGALGGGGASSGMGAAALANPVTATAALVAGDEVLNDGRIRKQITRANEKGFKALTGKGWLWK